MTPPAPRSQDELQRAHDIIVGALTGEVPLVFDHESRKQLQIAANVLCWALRHEHNRKFGEALLELEAQAFAKGYSVEPIEGDTR